MALGLFRRILCAIVATFYLLLVLYLCSAHALVDPANIVPDVNAGCPVSTTLYSENEFTVDRLYALMLPLVSSGSAGSKCAATVPGMTVCASDGTLQVKEGCCSVACARKMQQALLSTGPSCYREFIEVMCNTTDIRQGISAVLFNAARRCLGLRPSCELLAQPGDLLNATATDNATAAAGGASVGGMTAANATAANPSDVNAAATDATVVGTQGNATGNGTAGSPLNSTRSSGSVRLGANSTTGSSNSSAVSTAADARPGPPGPDPFMPLVPRPVVESVALATPDEIDQAASNSTLGGASSNTSTTAAAPAGTSPNGTTLPPPPAAAAALAPGTAVTAVLSSNTPQGAGLANSTTAANTSTSSQNQAAVAPKPATSHAGGMVAADSTLEMLVAYALLALAVQFGP